MSNIFLFILFLLLLLQTTEQQPWMFIHIMYIWAPDKSTRTLCLVLMIAVMAIRIHSGQQSQQTPSAIYPICSKNIKKIMACSAKEGPIYCQLEEDWLLLFYNSSDYRQKSTLQHLIPWLAAEMYYTGQYKPNDNFTYPPTAVIDCHSCASLCEQVSQKQLPLVLYRLAEHDEVLRYRGYVSLPGLISFIKSHDPATSLIVEVWQEASEGLLWGNDNLGKEVIGKQMEWVSEGVRAGEEKARLAIQKLVLTPEQTHHWDTANTTDQPVAGGSYAEQNEAEAIGKDADNKQKYQNRGKENKINEKSQQRAPQQKNTTVNKAKSGAKQGQGSKKQSDDGVFMQIVDSSSKAVVQLFAQLGVGGLLLNIIGWISYVFFFIFFGVLCLIVHAL